METTRGILKSHSSLGCDQCAVRKYIEMTFQSLLTVANGATNAPEAPSTVGYHQLKDKVVRRKEKTMDGDRMTSLSLVVIKEV
jgi:hypothetical protein